MNNQDSNESQSNESQSNEPQYLDLLKHILNSGFMENGRNGITKSIFGHSMRFSLENQKRENINDYEFADFEIIGYQCHDPIKVDMVV